MGFIVVIVVVVVRFGWVMLFTLHSMKWNLYLYVSTLFFLFFSSICTRQIYVEYVAHMRDIHTALAHFDVAFFYIVVSSISLLLVGFLLLFVGLLCSPSTSIFFCSTHFHHSDYSLAPYMLLVPCISSPLHLSRPETLRSVCIFIFHFSSNI